MRLIQYALHSKQNYWSFFNTFSPSRDNFLWDTVYDVYILSIHVLQSSGISRKSAALIVIYSQKKKWISIVFYFSENPSIAHNLGTTGSIQVGFSANCTSPSEHFYQTENWKMSHVRVPTDPARSHHILLMLIPYTLWNAKNTAY